MLVRMIGVIAIIAGIVMLIVSFSDLTMDRATFHAVTSVAILIVGLICTIETKRGANA